MWTIGCDHSVVLGVTFLSSSGPTNRPWRFAEPAFQLCFPCCSENSQTSFCLYTLLLVSDQDELVFGPYRYLFDRVPPQPNCPLAGVFFRVSISVLRKWCYIVALCMPESMHASLPLTLCNQSQNTATSYSKVPQGLCFPLGVPGLCTGRSVQKFLGRDSRHLVKPFMQVTIQMTRHFAHVCYFPP